jgi:SAM-dependent methyltransferase
MLQRVLHRIVAVPFVYNLVQRLAGREEGHRRMRPFLKQTGGGTVLEVGAGTGDWAQVLPPTARYIWFDNDPQKLAGFRARGTRALALLGDAARMCLKDKSVNWALCVAVSHHLTDDEFRQFLRSLARVSREGLIFLDGLRTDDAWISRLLWKYDRGANPRKLEALKPFIEEFFEIEREEQFAVYHRYWVCQARPRA